MELIEEFFKNINSKADTKEFIKVIENEKLYEIIYNQIENEIERVKVLEFIRQKATITSNTKYWKTMSDLMKKKFEKKEENNNFLNSKNTNFTDFEEQPMSLYCGNWKANNYDGIVKYKGEQEIRAGFQPILVTKRFVNIENDEEKFEVSYYDQKKWKKRNIPRTTISNTNSITKLVNYGIDVSSNTASALCTYMSDLYVLNKDTIPIEKSISHLGWTDNTFKEFLPYFSKDIACDVDGEMQKINSYFCEYGNYDKWKESVLKARQNNNVRIYMSASFASPLIRLLDINGFITHLYGDRGKGKTVSLMLAMSIWGNPDNGKLTNSVNNTMFALECKAEFLQNLPFAGDELININKKEMNYDDLIYMISNGSGKSRGTMDGSFGKMKHWKLIMMTTGENSITSDNSHSGSKVRCIEIENDKEMYDGIDLMEFSEVIKNNYGFAGKEFIKKVIELGPEEIKKRFTDIKLNIQKISEDKLDAKQLNAASALKLADDLVCEYIFTEQEKLNPIEFLKLIKDEQEISVAERAKQYIISEIRAERNSFDMENSEQNEHLYRGRVKGKIEGNVCYIILNDLKDMLYKGGFNFNEVKEKWSNMGFLISYSSRKKYYNSDAKYGTIVRLLLNGDNDYQLVDDFNNLPF